MIRPIHAFFLWSQHFRLAKDGHLQFCVLHVCWRAAVAGLVDWLWRTVVVVVWDVVYVWTWPWALVEVIVWAIVVGRIWLDEEGRLLRCEDCAVALEVWIAVVRVGFIVDTASFMVGSMTASMGMVLDLVVAVPCEGNAI